MALSGFPFHHLVSLLSELVGEFNPRSILWQRDAQVKYMIKCL